MADARIEKELESIRAANVYAIESLGPLAWRALLRGPPGTPYEGGVFALKIDFTHDYPFVAPMLAFETWIFHHMVNPLEMITYVGNNWNGAWSVAKLLDMVTGYLVAAQLEHARVPEIAKLYTSHRAHHDQLARAWVQRYARTTPPHAATLVIGNAADGGWLNVECHGVEGRQMCAAVLVPQDMVLCAFNGALGRRLGTPVWRLELRLPRGRLLTAADATTPLSELFAADASGGAEAPESPTVASEDPTGTRCWAIASDVVRSDGAAAEARRGALVG